MEKSHFLDEPRARFLNACILEDQLWFSAEKFNGLGYINLLNAQMVYVDEIPGEDKWADLLYSDIVCYKGKLILAPCSAKEVSIYDIKEKQFTKIGIKTPPKHLQKYYLPHRKFRNALVVNDSVYFMPNSYPAIMELNLLTGEVHYYDEWVKKVHQLEMVGYCYSACYPIVNEHIIYMASMCTNAWLEFDTQSKNTSLSVRKDSEPCCCMTKTKKKWILAENTSGKVVTFLCDKLNEEESVRFAQTLPDGIPFLAYKMITVGEAVFILLYNDTLLRLDTDSNELSEVRKGIGNNIEFWGFLSRYKNRVFYYDGKTNTMNFYTEEGTFIKKIKVIVPEWFWSKNEESMIRQAGVQEYCERELALNEYIKLLKIKNATVKKENCQTGKNIYSDLWLNGLGQMRKESGY